MSGGWTLPHRTPSPSRFTHETDGRRSGSTALTTAIEKALAGGKSHLMPCFLSDGTAEPPLGGKAEEPEDWRAEALAERRADQVPSAPPGAVPMAEAVGLRRLRPAAG